MDVFKNAILNVVFNAFVNVFLKKTRCLKVGPNPVTPAGLFKRNPVFLEKILNNRQCL